MKTAIKPIGAFLLWWIIAQLAYAFVVMDWSWLTEWDSRARAVNLVISTYIAFFVWLFTRGDV